MPQTYDVLRLHSADYPLFSRRSISGRRVTPTVQAVSVPLWTCELLRRLQHL
jgi:hypothetical protein